MIIAFIITRVVIYIRAARAKKLATLVVAS
jgi:hypothetical protein